MNIYNYLKEFLTKELTENTEKIVFEPTKNPLHGDIATNAAMIMAPVYQKSPKEIAIEFISILKKNSYIESLHIAGPGFINMTLKKKFWQEQLNTILFQKMNYANIKQKGEKINVEFISANPTGPLHIGHARNAVLGDSLANLLKKAGYETTKEYYINDAGGQIQALAKSVFNRYKEIMNLPMDPFTDDMYEGDFVIPIAEKLYMEHGKDLLQRPDILEFISNYSVDYFMQNIKDDLKNLGIVMDKYVSEKEIINNKWLDKAYNVLFDRGDIYQGTLPLPKGHQKEEDQSETQILFKSTSYGDDVDRCIQKHNQEWTYFAGDIGYHFYKINQNYDFLINVFGADHSGYITRMKAAVLALGFKKFDIKTCQLVSFLENGEPVKMSKRAGNFITLKELVEKVGKDAVRYMMLSRHHDVGIDFDFEKVIAHTQDNPVFYIQYAYARICSVFRHATSLFDHIPEGDLTLLTQTHELKIIQFMSDLPRQIETSAKMLEPHRIALYIHSLSVAFHKLWSLGKHELRFIDQENPELTFARLSLLKGVKIILEIGFEILGMSLKEEM